VPFIGRIVDICLIFAGVIGGGLGDATNQPKRSLACLSSKVTKQASRMPHGSLTDASQGEMEAGGWGEMENRASPRPPPPVTPHPCPPTTHPCDVPCDTAYPMNIPWDITQHPMVSHGISWDIPWDIPHAPPPADEKPYLNY